MHRAKALIVLAGLVCTHAFGAVAFNGESALGFTGKLVAFGPRPAGSEAHKTMERYLTAQLKLFGCATEEIAWTATTPIGPKPMKNYLVRIPGSSARPVVLSGHYDTKWIEGSNFVGANDGGSSAGFLLEVARILCRSRGADPLWLLWLDGEEAFRQWTETDSLYGSRYLSQ
ncbi:MAG: M28 family peptidase, partial [Bryobacteraceae bacterium]|nr:M28 family peptidase [Bryobacteraceae bacterium]